jgi:hypothetical protein
LRGALRRHRTQQADAGDALLIYRNLLLSDQLPQKLPLPGLALDTLWFKIRLGGRRMLTSGDKNGIYI